MEEKIVELLSGLQTAIENLAPEAWLALVLAAKVQAVRNVALGTLAAVWFSVYAWIAIRRVVPFLCKERLTDAEVGPRVAFLIIGGLAAAVCFMAAVTYLSATSTWLGLVSPEAQVVRELLNAAKP